MKLLEIMPDSILAQAKLADYYAQQEEQKRQEIEAAWASLPQIQAVDAQQAKKASIAEFRTARHLAKKAAIKAIMGK